MASPGEWDSVNGGFAPREFGGWVCWGIRFCEVRGMAVWLRRVNGIPRTVGLLSVNSAGLVCRMNAIL